MVNVMFIYLKYLFQQSLMISSDEVLYLVTLTQDCASSSLDREESYLLTTLITPSLVVFSIAYLKKKTASS